MADLREQFTRNGHRMEIQPWYGQGDGIETMFLWCYTCDPAGDGIEGGTVDMRTVAHVREAQLRLRKLAFQHSKGQVPLHQARR